MSLMPRPLRDQVFLAVDTETTGRPTSAGGLIEIAAVRFRGSGEVLGTFSQLIRPRHSVSPFATKVHGLHTADLKDQPCIEQVMPLFGAFLEVDEPIVLAHNAGFDLSYLSVAFQASGMELPRLPVYCTLDIARKLMPESPGYKLGVIGDTLGLPQGVLHRALADCVLLKDVFVHWVSVFSGFDTVEELESGYRKWTFGIRKRKVRSRRRRGPRSGDPVVADGEQPEEASDALDTAEA
jgi:DNA polymerase-3 subunit epsilon